MWYVKGIWCDRVVWWGAFVDRETAEKVASRVRGTVFSQEEVNQMKAAE
jgi:hypothetical protein